MFRKLREWISDNRFWYGVLQRTIMERNHNANEAVAFKAMAKHYEDLWQRSVDDHAASLSFYQAQVAQLTKERDEKRIAFTLPNGVELFAELNEDIDAQGNPIWRSIDVIAHMDGRRESVCCADFEFATEVGEPRGLRVFSFNGIDDEYCHEVDGFDFWYLLGKDELDPETEQDYIDQIVQEQADRDSQKVEHVRVLHPVRHKGVYKLALNS